MATVTVTVAPPGAPACTLIANPTSIATGSASVLSWTTTNTTGFSIDNGIGFVTPVVSGTNSVSPSSTVTYTGTATSTVGFATCTATVTVTTGGGSGGGGGGGGGGGSLSPTITLAALPHVTAQPLAYLYLSQIPYTGLDLGPVGTAFYWIALIVFALALAYVLLFRIMPPMNRSLRTFGSRVSAVLNARQELTPAPPSVPLPATPTSHAESALGEAPRGYSTYEGFKSFAHEGALSIDDIVKGLSSASGGRMHPLVSSFQSPASRVEPVYENVEPIAPDVAPETNTMLMPPHIRDLSPHAASVKGFAAALLEGDRAAVFAGLRQHIRGSGAPDRLLSSVVCLIDDAYRARIDGTACDHDIARLTARLDTPTLERLIAALTTAIDSSYSAGVTGAKLALTRALTVLGV